MNNKERQPETFTENTGRIIRTGGIIAGIIGIITNPGILVGGIVVAIGGEVIRRTGKKRQ